MSEVMNVGVMNVGQSSEIYMANEIIYEVVTRSDYFTITEQQKFSC